MKEHFYYVRIEGYIGLLCTSNESACHGVILW